MFAEPCGWLIKLEECALTNLSQGIVFLAKQPQTEISCELAYPQFLALQCALINQGQGIIFLAKCETKSVVRPYVNFLALLKRYIL